MEVVTAVTSRPAIERVLRHMGFAAEAPKFHPARPPPQVELPFVDEAQDFFADAPAPEDGGG